ncbi:hypothetical protein [Ligilactobacillus ruminis]|uniref:hypothetical protein n=1 Tax=Ligilactobacillus ruminis TaxID=1623 RepID=UPI0034A5359F
MDIQAENKKEFRIPKSAMAIFSVASVLFSAHAGGGFATGNQENTYFVSLGWSGIISLVLAMFLLTMTMREAMIMYNKFNLKSHKQLFEKLYHPFDKLEILFEVFFDIMVVMAVAAAVSGAASALQQYLGWNYYVNIVIVGAIILCLTIFGAGVVRKASTYMGIAIMFCVLIIYIVGIRKAGNFGTVMSASFAEQGFSQVPHAIGNAFTYAGFQCVTLPTMLACGAIFSGNKNHAEAKSMTVSFIMNTIALGLAVIMLMCWQSTYGSSEAGMVLPTLTTLKSMHMGWMMAIYGITLILCLTSTGVTTTFAFVSRFENSKIFSKVENPVKRRMAISAFIIILSMTISLVGLTNIIKYGYGYCGYLAIAIVVVPFLTVGVYKNRKA